ncbi:hypothetical protein HH214_05080 [Mucilaginibacter robiniae]|uniref:CotH protein n=1 Tax=Mucilaginibacter robiniae TaxID=2728022 RepID=A0A7L5DZ26_9SPHI|nr:CotH kinase family protein [Mucilaginibacter robiniae]QJD95289.1 hypothetical protein HH214_05080 [Mucilaginibacter robiniae]
MYARSFLCAGMNILVLYIMVSISGCRKYDNAVTSNKKDSTTTTSVIATSAAAITSAKLELKNNIGKITADVACTINSNDQIIAVIPDVNATKKLALTFTTKTTGAVVKVKDTLQVSGTTITDYSKAVTYNVTSPDGTTKTYQVLIKVFTGLPILDITTSGPVGSKDDYVKGSLVVNPNVEYEQAQTKITMQIKGRGNSTWVLYPKKPYRLKFDSKTAMLGMPAAKNWVLLANYNDKTLMRNRLALLLGKRLGADYTSDSRFVEVFMNGEFLGNYLLTAQVEVDANRVNITSMKTTDTAASTITGGYLLELDQKMDADYWFKTKKGLPFSIKDPSAITPAQLKYISGYIQSTEDALFASNFTDPVNGYAKYINPDSFMNWYFTEEIFETTDARDFSSIFYYKDRNGKLGMGPIWDFDTSSGNVDYADSKNPTGIWYIRDATWMLRLAQDPAFMAKVKTRWAAIKDNEIKQIFTDIDQNAAYLKLSQQQNFAKWPILSTYVYPNAVVLGNYDSEVAYLKSFLTQRISWMNANMAAW